MIKIEFLSRFGLIKSEEERVHKTRNIKEGNLETREKKNSKTKEEKNKKQQEKEREDRGSIHQDLTKTNKHTSLTKSHC